MEKQTIEIRGEHARSLIGKIPSAYLRYGIIAVIAVLALTLTVLCLIKVPGYESYEIVILNESSDVGDNGFIIIPAKQHIDLTIGERLTVYDIERKRYINSLIGDIIKLGDIELITTTIENPSKKTENCYKALIPVQKHSIFEWIFIPEIVGNLESYAPSTIEIN